MGWIRKDKVIKKPVKKVVKKKVTMPKVEEPVEELVKETVDEEEEFVENDDEEDGNEETPAPIPQQQVQSSDWSVVQVATQTEPIIYEKSTNKQLTLHQAVAELLNRTE